MAQKIRKKYIQDAAVDATKILFENNQALQAKKFDGSGNLEVFKINSQNKIEFLDGILAVAGSDNNSVVVKSQLDGAIASESAARVADIASLQSVIDAEALLRAAEDVRILDEAKAYTDAEVLVEKNRAEGVESGLNTRLTSAESDIDSLESGLAQEILDRQSGDSGLQTQIDTEKGRIDAILSASEADKDSFAEIVALINSVDATNDSAFAGYVLSNDARVAALEAFNITQVMHVSKNGNDTTGTGGQHSPFLTLAKAFSMITDASPTKRYVVRVAAGAYTETSVALPSNVFVIGEQKETVRITGAVSMGAWTQNNAGSDDRSGFSMVTLVSAANFNWDTAKSRAGKLYMNEVVFVSTLNLYGYDNAIAQAQFDSCVIFGAMTVSGINVGVFSNNTCYNNVTLNQHPNGGMASIFSASGGYCSSTMRFNTTANDFNRRSSGFLRSFPSENLIIDGPSSYADVDLISQGKSSTQKLNGGNLVALNPRISHDLETQMIKPLNTNSHNMGDWGKQWMFNFGYIHASSGTDLYLTSVDSSYDAAGSSAGYSVHIEADGYGLKPNISGGDINVKTGTVSGTGVRGKIKLDAREIDASSVKITNLASGVDAADAVNKGQLDAAVAGMTQQTYIDAQDAATLASANAYTDQKVADLVDSAPALLDTLNELAQALGDDPNFATSVTSQISSVSTEVTNLKNGIIFRKESFTLSASNMTNGYVEMQYEAAANSMNAFTEGLAIHEGVDYSLSVVGGKTRLALLSGDFAAGDKVYVQYFTKLV